MAVSPLVTHAAARNPALLIGVVVVAVLIAAADGYGYHRDELYFIAAGEHLAWGYPDQGPVAPLIARAMQELAPDSLTVLRIPSALATGALVLLTGVMTRELGGGRRAEALAAACAGIGVVFLFTGHLLSTTTFDLLAWTALTFIVIRAVRTDDDRFWIPAGVLLGIALLNKPLPAFLAVGLLIGVAIAGPRRLLRSPWVWAGAAIALLVWLPWLVWQTDHDWPQVDVSSSIAEGGSTSSEPRWALLPFQLLLVSPFLAPVWIAGLVRLFRDPELRDLRFLGWTWAALAVIFIATGGKPYYLAGLLPLLLAAGAPAVDRWLERGRRGLRRSALAAALALSAVVSALISLPLLPLEELDPVIAMNDDVANTVGWPDFTRTVAEVRDGLPDGDQAIIFTRNYGEAGAVDRFGPDHGLPRAFSGHNGYAEWGTPPGSKGPAILVGFDDRGWVERRFSGCAIRARIEAEGGVDTEEDGEPIWVCEGPRRPWRDLWPDLRVFG
jgi:4-amino-4-deoxy-L-arabinose transferase-like glycosyltransferase